MATDLVIAGAGMGGLATAIAAAEAGFSVTVLEQADEIREVGAGLTLGPNAMKCVRALGVEDRIRDAGYFPLASAVRDGATGKLLVNIPRRDVSEAKYGAPYLTIHRADLQNILLDRLKELPGTKAVTSAAVATVEAGDDTATAICADGRRFDGRLVIGADGVHSAVRDHLHEHVPASFSGYVAWRMLLPADSLPGDLGIDGACLFIAPGRTAVRYPVRGGKLINVVAFAERSGWTEEGWSIPGDKNELCAVFDDFCPEIRTLLAAADPARLFKWALLYRPPLPVYARGRVGLVGDAAHPVLPFLGMGAALALEDAIMLGRMIASNGTTPEALLAYDAARRARCDFVLAESAAAVKRYHAGHPEFYSEQVHKSPDKLDLYSYDAATVAI